MVLTGFGHFDNACGGLRDHKDYLVYGAMGGGKTSLGLSFLYQGLLRDETVALVMRRRPSATIQHARALGWDLEPFLQQHKLILIEYPEDLDQRLPRLHEGADMVAELRTALDGVEVSRLVFDPAGPLFGAGGGVSALRMRGVVEGFAALNATCLYLVDTPDDERYLAACKDYMFGVLHLAADRKMAGVRTLYAERLPGAELTNPAFTFEFQKDKGFVTSLLDDVSFGAAAESSFGPSDSFATFSFPGAAKQRRSGQLTALIAEPDAGHRQELVTAMKPFCTVVEAQGAADCLSRSQRETPDLIVLAMEMPGINGIEIVRKLRRSGVRVPIIMTGNSMRRLADRVRALASGADIVLLRPFDLRTFKLHARNLLTRSSAVNERAAHLRTAFDVSPEPRRGAGLCTSEFEELKARLAAESRYCRANDLPFTVVSFFTKDLAEEIGGVCSYISRSNDFTFVGPTGAAVILAEGCSADGFLERFRERWDLPDIFDVECRGFDGSDSFAADLTRYLQDKFEIAPPARTGAVMDRQNGYSADPHVESAAVQTMRSAAGQA